jgi:hypothetical protein
LEYPKRFKTSRVILDWIRILNSYPTQVSPFAANNDQPIDSRIADVLWRWQDAAPNARDHVIANSDLPALVEFWFPFNAIEYARRRGIWCDGVLRLAVTELDSTSFRLIGVGYFPRDVAPFELDFHFETRGGMIPRSTIMRFGLTDNAGELRMVTPTRDPSHTMNNRPKQNSEWAIVVQHAASTPGIGG